ncbi:nicotinate phosphoribosyltransferase [Leuconostoc gelidum subsp. aenigmaticum]|uniref:nicotinate phosphoribosyltransferase n=1 Tax=Leuconostoc gelidum TaxID=1244 RepID=UPI001CC6BD27|nr:nicotinate phosphoribosyltransferase [Leuconostoc gelidum]MBZ6007961.1 nicotinate phosphoribosyltransferase [Leuconostoc gelidum subsp. aenigmaticum]
MFYPDDSFTLHTDLYQINMIYTYWQAGIDQKPVVFEAYFRDMPFNNGYVIFAGLAHIVQYLDDLHFSDSDIAYLQSLNLYHEDFLTYLKKWQLTATLRAPYEGEVMFDHEPLLQVEGPLIDAQLLETALLNIINFQTLIATKASRVVTVANGDPLMEFGTRRAQEFDAALWGTRAAYIGGFNATSNVRAGKLFNLPVSGTHAHALVQAYQSDYAAFKSYAKSHHDVVFLVDTFDTLKSGVPAAIKVAQEFGDKINFQGIRIDSGNMVSLSIKIRQMLDKSGFSNAKIYASNDLDEYVISDLKARGAKIDVWGVGTKVITSFDQPALGAVYKMVSIDGKNTIKLSDDTEKISIPGKKQIWRTQSGDVLSFATESNSGKPILHDIFNKGQKVYHLPTIQAIQTYAKNSLLQLPDRFKRLDHPDQYNVALSQQLAEAKDAAIADVRLKIKEN